MIRRASTLRSAALAVFALASAAFLFTATAAAEGPGQASRPAFSTGGRLVWVERTAGGFLRLVSVSAENPAARAETALDSPSALSQPQLRFDGQGRAWVAAVRRAKTGGQVVIGESSGPLDEIEAGPGSSAGPDFCFDSRGGLWLGWRQTKAGTESIRVRETTTSRTWALSNLDETALSFPRLVAAGDDRIWAVWSGKDRLGYGVFARLFDGRTWSARRRLASTGEWPCLAPDAGTDIFGRLWIAWSAYDGSDYEVYLIKLTGALPSAPVALTNETSSADEFPALAFLDGRFPVVAWARTGADGSKILAALVDETFVFAPVDLGFTPGGFSVPGLAAEGSRLAVLRAGQDGPELRTLAEADLRRWPSLRESPGRAPRRRTAPAAPTIIFNPALSERGYVSFGDSITYGYLAGADAPSKGYVPRLEALLDTAFGPTDVWNAGVPGEYTSQGLARFEALLAARKVRYVLIMEGTNDVKEIIIPIETSIFNLKEMLRKALAYGAFPAIATVIPRRDWIWFYQEYKDRHNALVAAIKQMAADLKIPLLDLNQEFNAYPGGPDALLDTDGKHPNEKGYQFMAERWFEAVGKFPFPAANIQIAKKYDKILFYRLPGQMITWQASPKIAAPSVVQGYRIYRRNSGEGADKFRFLMLVTEGSLYFDTALQGVDAFEYVIATLRTDGIEGPCSELMKSR